MKLVPKLSDSVFLQSYGRQAGPLKENPLVSFANFPEIMGKKLFHGSFEP